MGLFRIAVSGSGDELAAVRAMRSRSDASVSDLRARIRDSAPLLEIDTNDVLPLSDTPSRHAEIRDAIEALQTCGYETLMSYSPDPRDEWEDVSAEQMENLFVAELEPDPHDR